MPECQYNGIDFSMIHMVRFDQEAQYDPSGTDYVGTKVSIGLAAVLSGVVDNTGIIQKGNAVLPPTETPTDKTIQNTITRIRSILETPRKRLIFQDDTSLLIDVTGDPQQNKGTLTPQFDIKNGPFPRVLGITRFDGSTTYHVMFTVEAYIVECPGTFQATTQSGNSKLLSHRWTETQTIDKLFFTTYRRSGRIIIAANPQAIAADQAGRSASFIPLRNGFRREEQEYTLSEDGLALMYRIADRQLFRTVPGGALDCKATYSERTGLGATMRDAAVSVRVFGAPTSPQQTQMDLAVIIASTRLTTANFNANQNNPPVNGLASGIFKSASLSYDMFENVVDVNIEANLPLVSDLRLGLPFPVTQFCLPPVGSKDYISGQGTMPISNTFGNESSYNPQTAAQLFLVAAALGVPCKTPAVGAAIANQNANVQIAQATATQVANAADANQGGQATNYNADGGLYTEYTLRPAYRDRQNILQLPTATPAGGSKLSSIVQWANPMADVVVEWTASKVGTWPTVPSKISSDNNLVYVEGEIYPGTPILRGDGVTVEYTLSGKYYYAAVDADKVSLNTGLPDYLSPSIAAATKVPTGAFSAKIMNPSGTTQGQTPQITNIKP
jgi:hypothetical protein